MHIIRFVELRKIAPFSIRISSLRSSLKKHSIQWHSHFSSANSQCRISYWIAYTDSIQSTKMFIITYKNVFIRIFYVRECAHGKRPSSSQRIHSEANRISAHFSHITQRFVWIVGDTQHNEHATKIYEFWFTPQFSFKENGKSWEREKNTRAINFIIHRKRCDALTIDSMWQTFSHSFDQMWHIIKLFTRNFWKSNSQHGILPRFNKKFLSKRMSFWRKKNNLGWSSDFAIEYRINSIILVSWLLFVSQSIETNC